VKPLSAGTPVPEPSAQVVAGCPNELAAALAYLRHEGCSPIQTIKVVINRFGLGLGEAKLALHASPAWRDVTKAQEEWVERMLVALEDEDAERQD
jgi:hypothetical protein